MAASLHHPTDSVSTNDFPVVGIGASAGGLEAFKSFVQAIPAKSGMAFIFVQHFTPGHASALQAIMRKISKIPVLEITDNVNIQPDCLYLIPINKFLTAVNGALKLESLNETQKNIKSIDHLFTTLGTVYQSFAVGVVLSGTLDDGTWGLKVIKFNGGITFAQDEQSAAYDDMPKNAIKGGAVDFVLPPGKIVEQLIEINHSFKTANTNNENSIKSAPEGEKVFRSIIALLQLRRGVDFSHYKQPTLKRRIARRMALNQIENSNEYLVQLNQNKVELDALFEDMLISVTGFFRDSANFDVLSNKIIPSLIKQNSVDQTFRVWVAGCASGEEAYSIAICLVEMLRQRTKTIKIQIFATDISERAIAKARIGKYKKAELEGVSSSRLEQFFTRLDGEYQINKSIRELCIFAKHNFLKDPPFSKIDLINCRNVLIYLDPVFQKKALITFHYALNEKGILMLGKSETVNATSDLFTSFDDHEKVYSRIGPSGGFMSVVTERKEQNLKNYYKAEEHDSNGISDVYRKADDVVLSKYAPQGVIINQQFDIVQFRGVTDTWLSPSPGKASLNILKMARNGLAFELRNILTQAKSKNASAKKGGIPFRSNGAQYYVSIEAIPLIDLPNLHYLVLFQNEETPDFKNEQGSSLKNRPTTVKGRDPRDIRIEQLERELIQSREDIREIIEEQEAANEELQSANEELLSGGEELQTLNEELETSKEELQSTNEELTISNNELLDRNEQLNNARKFSEGIINTIRDPLMILDMRMVVKSATAGFYKKFKFTENETEGKFLFELGNKQWNIDGLRNQLTNILPVKKYFSDFEVTHVFPILGKKTMILNGLINRINGEDFILLSIEDITDRKKVEEAMAALKRMNKVLEHSNRELEQFAYVASHDLQEPLRKIMTFSHMIENKNTELPANTKTYIQKIALAAQRMEKLIKDLLNFSRINDKEKIFIPISLNKIVENVISDFELTINEKNAAISHGDLPEIEGSPLQMHQLFQNLLGNALKFTTKNVGPIINIQSKKLTEDELGKHPLLNSKNTYFEISTEDNGIGFDEIYAEQMFVIFQRLNTREIFPGTGIGLALCRKIVLNHQGEISANSKENGGAVFKIILPVKHLTINEPDMQ